MELNKGEYLGKNRIRSGAKVEDLQKRLVEAGANIAVDGRFGPQTEGALKAFQGEQGVAADGILGPKTLAKLNAAAQNSGSNGNSHSGVSSLPGNNPVANGNNRAGAAPLSRKNPTGNRESQANATPQGQGEVKPGSVKPGSGGADAGQATVDYARKFKGMLSQNVKGKMKHFQAAGGRTNNCADFVSSALAATNRGVKHTASVSELRSQLLKKGWKAIPRSEARPGDVWMTTSNTHGNRHVELVASPGGTKTIGSNSLRRGQQHITERPKGPAGIIYAYRP